jgi:hypothetical protein
LDFPGGAKRLHGRAGRASTAANQCNLERIIACRMNGGAGGRCQARTGEESGRCSEKLASIGVAALLTRSGHGKIHRDEKFDLHFEIAAYHKKM